MAHCTAGQEPPSFVEVISDHRVVARCASTELALEALADGVIRMRYQPVGVALPDRSFAVTRKPEPATMVAMSSSEGSLELCTPDLRVRVEPTACRITATDADGKILIEDGDEGGFSEAEGSTLIRRLPGPEEHFYGFGERTGPLDKRGQTMTFWNTDAYDPALGGYRPDQDPLYQSIPFYLGLREGIAYGLFTDNPHRLEMDMAASGEYAEVRAQGGAIDQYLIAGPAMAEVVRRYTSLTGRMPMPPRWALGFHQSRWGYSPAESVEALGARFRDEKIPADVLWLDIQHLDGFRTFTWDPQNFPDPEGLTSRLRDLGFKVIAIADPGIKVDPGWGVYDRGLAGDHFLRWPNGELFTGEVWPGESAFPDFSRSDTQNWWGQELGALIARGVQGVWLDVNEPTVFPESGGGSSVPNDVPAAGEGTPTTMAEIHNVYALLEAKASYQGLLAAAPEARPFLLSRAGYAGIQRYAAVWTGDVVSDWDGLELTLPMLLNLGLSGVPLVGSDVGGYSGGASPELFARWMALGSVSPFFRAHVTSGVPGQEPWQFGTEVRDLSRTLIEERYRWLPYLYSLVDEAVRTGAPILRPLVYEFQAHQPSYEVSDQAMLGPFLLLAPVLEPGSQTRKVLLPPGRWFEIHSGALYEGPGEIEVSTTLAALPLFAREGAILPRGPLVQHEGAAPLSPLSLDLYPSSQASSFLYYEDSGDGHEHRDGGYSRIRYQLEQLEDGARLAASQREGSYEPAPRPLEIRVRRVDQEVEAVKLDDRALPELDSLSELREAGEGWWHDPRDRSLMVVMADRDDFELRLFYDPQIAEPRPEVDVELLVELPPSTPQDAPITVATSANGWTHQPLTRVSDTLARGTVSVPRGEWFEFKYSRGGWDSVETWPGCQEAKNRYRFGAARLSQEDTVFEWSDTCQ